MIMKQNLSSLDLKKDIYYHISTAIYGLLVAQNQEKESVVKNVYFANDEQGFFYIFAYQTPETSKIAFDFPAIFSICKEEEIASDTIEVIAHGKLQKIDTQSEEYKKGLALFEEKSPFLGNLPWLSHSKNYQMLSFNPYQISFQPMKNERSGKKPFILNKIEGE